MINVMSLLKLIYYAFVKPNLIQKNLFGLPMLFDSCDTLNTENSGSTCAAGVTINLLVIFIGGQVIERFQELGIPLIQSHISKIVAYFRKAHLRRKILRKRKQVDIESTSISRTSTKSPPPYSVIPIDQPSSSLSSNLPTGSIPVQGLPEIDKLNQGKESEDFNRLSTRLSAYNAGTFAPGELGGLSQPSATSSLPKLIVPENENSVVPNSPRPTFKKTARLIAKTVLLGKVTGQNLDASDDTTKGRRASLLTTGLGLGGSNSMLNDVDHEEFLAYFDDTSIRLPQYYRDDKLNHFEGRSHFILNNLNAGLVSNDLVFIFQGANTTNV